MVNLIIILNGRRIREIILFSAFKKHVLTLSDIYSYIGIIQQLRNPLVPPTGMGKNYGRIMPLLR